MERTSETIASLEWNSSDRYQAPSAPAPVEPRMEPQLGAGLAALNREIGEQLSWERQRHDLEMRQSALLAQLSRLLERLSVQLARYDELQLERAAADLLPAHQPPLPPGLHPLVDAAWQGLNAGGH